MSKNNFKKSLIILSKIVNFLKQHSNCMYMYTFQLFLQFGIQSKLLFKNCNIQKKFGTLGTIALITFEGISLKNTST